MRTLKSFIGVAIVGASLAFALPAGAHHAMITGVASCSDGAHLVTWTIANDNSKKAMSVTATASAEGVDYGVSGVTNPIASGASTTATTVVPGGVTGTVTITVVGIWTDEFTKTMTATVGLPDKCTPTETTAPPTTAPTPTSSGVSPASIVPTSAPTGVAGVESVPGSLPNTGSSNTGTIVAIGLGLTAAGAGLVAMKRRPARRVS